MDHTHWEQRWAENRIGFHRTDTHPFLVKHHRVLADAPRVYVPLCGKSLDLAWLRQRGHIVFGTEIVALAIAQLFQELGETPTLEPRPPFRAHCVPGLCALEGDALSLEPAHLGGPVDAVYDRASLIAVDTGARAGLVDSMFRVLRPGGRILLVTLVYDQTKADGPPWSVNDESVRALFESRSRVSLLDQQQDQGSPSLRAAGITLFDERAYLIETR